MAIRYRDEGESFKGAVLKLEEHFWMDGMLEVTAVCWNADEQKIERHQVGYFGIDNQNLCGCGYEVDATVDTWRQVLRYLRPAANSAFARSVIEYKNGIRKGTNAVVVKGRKVPKGTKVEVFWVGERETFQSRKYHWMHETETVAGCHDENGETLWVKVEYLQSIDPIKSPNAKERRKFIKAYIESEAHRLGAPWKMRA